MAKELVPIRVRIGLRTGGHADYPNWSQVLHPENQRPGKDGGGWHYDKCGHTKFDADSPVGTQYGMLLVSSKFADAAVSTFPDRVSIMTEVEAEDFYNNKAYAHIADVKRNMEVLNGLKVEYDLRRIVALDTAVIEAQIARAIDPDNVEPGIQRNDEKTWVGFKAKRDISIKAKL